MRVGPAHVWIEAISEIDPSAVPPAAVPVRAMIDTGAGGTVISAEVIEALNLQPVGTVGIVTASTTAEPMQCERFCVDLHFPNDVTVADTVVIRAPLGRQNIQCLIGRDILNQCVLIYVGHLNQYTLGF
jgi:predicted aspartyl protease